MGNFYRIMLNIELTCRLAQEIEANSEKFYIAVNTGETVYSLQKKIKETKSEIFSNVKAQDLHLRMVQDDKNKGMEELIEGELSKFWDKQPSKKATHLIVDSPYLVKSRESQEKDENITQLTDRINRLTMQDRELVEIPDDEGNDLEELGDYSDDEIIDNAKELSELLITIRNQGSRYNNSTLQLAFQEGHIHEGEDVNFYTYKKPESINTLKVVEEWAYIEYENEYYTSITNFVKAKLKVNKATSDQRRRVSIGDKPFKKLRQLLGKE